MRLKPSHRSSPLSTARQLLTSQSVPLWSNAELYTCSRRESAARLTPHANILMPPDRAKLPDYIEVILYCKEAFTLRFGLRTSYVTLIPIPQKNRIDCESHRLFQRNGTHMFRW